MQGNLNTHDPSGLYEFFPPAQAKSMLDRLEFHFTPQTRQLAQYGRNRAERVEPTMSE